MGVEGVGGPAAEPRGEQGCQAREHGVRALAVPPALQGVDAFLELAQLPRGGRRGIGAEGEGHAPILENMFE
ncbi:hypothetical protein SAT01_17900 [Sinomonas atrocyanea]|nr:hypothetical protein SAT01_17900 [Sinomonas atrocyanea]